MQHLIEMINWSRPLCRCERTVSVAVAFMSHGPIVCRMPAAAFAQSRALCSLHVGHDVYGGGHRHHPHLLVASVRVWEWCFLMWFALRTCQSIWYVCGGCACPPVAVSSSPPLYTCSGCDDLLSNLVNIDGPAYSFSFTFDSRSPREATSIGL